MLTLGTLEKFHLGSGWLALAVAQFDPTGAMPAWKLISLVGMLPVMFVAKLYVHP